MSLKLTEKYFNKFYASLQAKAIPAFQINDENPQTVYSILGVFDLQIVEDMFHCYLLQGFNKLTEDLKKKVNSGQLSINEAKKQLKECSEILNKNLNEYECVHSKSKSPILYYDEIISNPLIMSLKGIISDDVTKMVKTLSTQIADYENNGNITLELCSIKNPLSGKLFIKKSIPSTKIEALFKELTRPGVEILRCSLYEFEQFIRGTLTSGIIKVSTKAAINTLVKQLKVKKWIDPLCKNYWNYVASHISDYKGETWTNKTLPKNNSSNKTAEVLNAFHRVGPIEE